MSGIMFDANSLGLTNFNIISECFKSKNSVCAGSSLLRHRAIKAGQIADLKSVAVMNLSFAMTWKRLLRTAADKLASFITLVRPGITLRINVF